MEKMRMETPDQTASNVEKIGALFPNCITETTDENGKLKKAVNFWNLLLCQEDGMEASVRIRK